MCLTSPAKLNLGLRIVGRRDDGYHLLESLFWPISVADSLEISPAERSSVSTQWAGDAVRPDESLPAEKDNLVYRALEKADLGSWEVRLTKRIPMGAGLGGGSSNAGTLLKWLGVQHPKSRERLEHLAPSLGADVPYFLCPQPAWVTGIGEQRKLLGDNATSQKLFFLLVLPREPLNTKEVFTAYRSSGRPFSTQRIAPLSGNGILSYLKGEAANDLEEAASLCLPRVGLLIQRLRREPVLYAGLTGTGSTCYAVFDSASNREKSAKVLQPFLRENFCRSLTAETFIAP